MLSVPLAGSFRVTSEPLMPLYIPLEVNYLALVRMYYSETQAKTAFQNFKEKHGDLCDPTCNSTFSHELPSPTTSSAARTITWRTPARCLSLCSAFWTTRPISKRMSQSKLYAGTLWTVSSSACASPTPSLSLIHI